VETVREPRPELKRELGLGSAVAAVAGEAIGVGIFLTPAAMAKSLGSPLWLLVVWLAGWCDNGQRRAVLRRTRGAFSTLRGGSYIYLQETYGPRTAFLYGWMCLLVLDPGLTAALATGAAAYAAYIFHWSPLVDKAAASFLHLVPVPAECSQHPE
jgi:APA family basic amino acid/polyamine antiporter